MRPLPADRIAPATTAVLTMEMQRGIVGDLAVLPALRDAVAEAGVADRVGLLLAEARRTGLPVVHATVGHWPDGQARMSNAPMLRHVGEVAAGSMVSGSPAAELLPQLGQAERDLVVERRHGVTPFTGTSLDATLRGLRVQTLVLVGVSLNMGILGTTMEAIGFGYSVVVPVDGVAGVPADYAQAVLRHSLRYLADLSTVADICSAWSRPEVGAGHGA